MTEDNQPVTLKNVKEQLGSLLLQWGFLEDTLQRRIEQLNGSEQMAPSNNELFGQRLKRWQELESQLRPETLKHIECLLDEALRLADIRNALAHRISGASADYKGVKAHIRLRSAASPSERTTLPYLELTDCVTAIERLRIQIDLLP